MAIQEKFKGVGVAMITPFHEDGSIDYVSLGKMIDYVIEGGVDYIVALGTTAETPTPVSYTHLTLPTMAVV